MTVSEPRLIEDVPGRADTSSPEVGVEGGKLSSVAATRADVPSPLLHVQDVSFRYDNGLLAVANADFEIARGEVLGLVGPSGCGKSTLLSLVAGITTPTTGHIWWDGGQGDDRHPISIVFQKDTLLPWLSVEKNVAFFFSLHSKRRRGSQEVVDQMLGVTGLTEFRKLLPHELSGGMRRRTAFASAMAAQPRLLLLDEPFMSLDEPNRIAIHQDVHEIVSASNTSVLLVTHDLAEAVTLCDRVAVISARPGHVVEYFDMPFGPDRDMFHLRAHPDFLELYGRIWDSLSAQISKSMGDPTPTQRTSKNGVPGTVDASQEESRRL